VLERTVHLYAIDIGCSPFFIAVFCYQISSKVSMFLKAPGTSFSLYIFFNKNAEKQKGRFINNCMDKRKAYLRIMENGELDV
jgi:hypothetical protein